MQINYIQRINILSNLTNQQKICFEIAKQNGYYNFPRSITLKELAKKVNLSYTTFQFHLRAAEKKLLNTFI